MSEDPDGHAPFAGPRPDWQAPKPRRADINAFGTGPMSDFEPRRRPHACRALKMDQDLGNIPVVLFSSADERDVEWESAGATGFLHEALRHSQASCYRSRFLIPLPCP